MDRQTDRLTDGRMISYPLSTAKKKKKIPVLNVIHSEKKIRKVSPTEIQLLTNLFHLAVHVYSLITHR